MGVRHTIVTTSEFRVVTHKYPSYELLVLQ